MPVGQTAEAIKGRGLTKQGANSRQRHADRYADMQIDTQTCKSLRSHLISRPVS